MPGRLILTGASGFVAGNILKQAEGKWEVHAVSSHAAPSLACSAHWHLLNPVTGIEALERLFVEIQPQAVIHSAAMADIDVCQKDPEQARLVNVGLTGRLAALCTRTGAKLVHLSTDTVFDGEKGLYLEEDLPHPVNFYGQTKVEAEQAVGSCRSPWVIARLALVMGLPAFAQGNSFMARMITALKEGREAGFPDNEIRSPVDVITLSRALLELAGNEFTGILHLAGNQVLNRYELGQQIAHRMGFEVNRVVVKNASDQPGRAPRPRDVSLNNAKARAQLKTPMLDLDRAIELVLSQSEG